MTNHIRLQCTQNNNDNIHKLLHLPVNSSATSDEIRCGQDRIWEFHVNFTCINALRRLRNKTKICVK